MGRDRVNPGGEAGSLFPRLPGRRRRSRLLWKRAGKRCASRPWMCESGRRACVPLMCVKVCDSGWRMGRQDGAGDDEWGDRQRRIALYPSVTIPLSRFFSSLSPPVGMMQCLLFFRSEEENHGEKEKRKNCIHPASMFTPSPRLLLHLPSPPSSPCSRLSFAHQNPWTPSLLCFSSIVFFWIILIKLKRRIPSPPLASAWLPRPGLSERIFHLVHADVRFCSSAGPIAPAKGVDKSLLTGGFCRAPGPGRSGRFWGPGTGPRRQFPQGHTHCNTHTQIHTCSNKRNVKRFHVVKKTARSCDPCHDSEMLNQKLRHQQF